MDAKQCRRTLFDSLQKEFSPTLDSSLIAALLVEIESNVQGNKVSPTPDQIDMLRATLGKLSLQAEESQQSEFSDIRLTSQFDETISSWTTPDNENAGTLTTGSSTSSTSSAHSFGSPLGFLQAALPEIPTARLSQALDDAEGRNLEMWDIIANILTEESIREMEERGLEALDDEDSYFAKVLGDNDWETVKTKNKRPVKSAKRKAKPQKVALADIRQQQHVLPISHHPARNNGLNTKHSPKHPPGSAADPWTQISSLSEHVATLLPEHPPSTFQSFFHSPKYATSYDALHAALISICKKYPSDSVTHTTVLFNFLDIIMPEYEDLDDAHRSRLILDVELAVEVTHGKGDEALDLVTLLRELDSNSDMGVCHAQPGQIWKSNKAEVAKASTSKPQLLSGPAVAPSLVSKIEPKPPPASAAIRKPSPFQWQEVPQRRPVNHGPHRLAHHIPAYSRQVNGNGGPISNANTNGSRRRMGECRRKRNEALLEASRMWQKGKTQGGEIAFYFAERAREFQEVARQEALTGAREMVLAKRSNSGNSDTIDLHGTTVAEAIVIVKEILDSEASISQGKPLKIITGRGTHSLNKVGVLKPAVRKALVEDGWSVSSWDGGLVVRHRGT